MHKKFGPNTLSQKFKEVRKAFKARTPGVITIFPLANVFLKLSLRCFIFSVFMFFSIKKDQGLFPWP